MTVSLKLYQGPSTARLQSFSKNSNNLKRGLAKQRDEMDFPQIAFIRVAPGIQVFFNIRTIQETEAFRL